jgi:hypothetical protein
VTLRERLVAAASSESDVIFTLGFIIGSSSLQAPAHRLR